MLLIVEIFSKAYALWLPLAEKGDPEVQEAIALLLANKVVVGIQFSADEREAATRYWILRAVKGGQKSAILWLSDAPLNGWHGFKKSEKGAECWKLVAVGQAVNADCEKFVVESSASH